MALGDLVSHEFAIEDGSSAYAALEEPGRMAILLRYPEAPRPVTKSVAIPAAGAVATAGTLRLGLIGPGLFARSTLLPLIEKLDAQLVAVAGGSGPRAVEVARRAGAAVASATADDLLADPDVDALVIATRHDSHASLAVRALEAGKAVFLEKPLAIDEPGLELVRAALERAGGRVVVDFNRRFAPTTEKVRAHFAGRSDPGLAVQVRVNAGALPADHWLRDPAVGGGRLVGEGCHFVDLCGAIVGAPLVSVAAVGLGPAPSTAAQDSFALMLTYADGSHRACQLHRNRISADGKGARGGHRCRAVGRHRGLPRVALYGSRRRPAVPPLGLSKDKGHQALFERFLAFARDGGEPPIPYASLLETTMATLGAREALRAAPGVPRRLGA